MSVIFLAGINNSVKGHWQRRWFRRLGGWWVEHADWARPNASDWVADLKRALGKVKGPRLLLCHSMGCLLAAEWARLHGDPGVAGAFLVGVPDVKADAYPKEAEGFGSPFGVRLPFPAMVVASRNDPYAGMEYSRRLAAHWGARLADVGEKGHINLNSGLGLWDEGLELLKGFLGSLPARHPETHGKARPVLPGFSGQG